jgi:hypothetical protein
MPDHELVADLSQLLGLVSSRSRKLDSVAALLSYFSIATQLAPHAACSAEPGQNGPTAVART